MSTVRARQPAGVVCGLEEERSIVRITRLSIAFGVLLAAAFPALAHEGPFASDPSDVNCGYQPGYSVYPGNSYGYAGYGYRPAAVPHTGIHEGWHTARRGHYGEHSGLHWSPDEGWHYGTHYGYHRGTHYGDHSGAHVAPVDDTPVYYTPGSWGY